MTKERRVTDHLRDGMLTRLGVEVHKDDLRDLRVSEWSREFEEKMRNRLIMGALRYGKLREGAPWDMATWIQRVSDAMIGYSRTGNAEHLVDLANMGLVAFAREIHPDHHFESIDRTT